MTFAGGVTCSWGISAITWALSFLPFVPGGFGLYAPELLELVGHVEFPTKGLPGSLPQAESDETAASTAISPSRRARTVSMGR